MQEDAAKSRDSNPERNLKVENRNLETKTVLVVDDEELIRILTESFLEQLGYNVLLADCGEAAVNIYREKSAQIQWVLSDITMPGIDGIETIRQLRAISPGLKAILSSGYSSEKIDTLPRDTVFLAKPYSINELRVAIDKISG